MSKTYGLTKPYQKHSTTSKLAAERLTTGETMKGDILCYIEAYPSGFTADELQEALMKKHPTVQAGTISARLRDLELAGKICKTTEERDTRNRRKANVWKSKAYAKSNEIIPARSDPEDKSARYIRGFTQIKDFMKKNGYGKDMKPVMDIVEECLTIKP